MSANKPRKPTQVAIAESVIVPEPTPELEIDAYYERAEQAEREVAESIVAAAATAERRAEEAREAWLRREAARVAKLQRQRRRAESREMRAYDQTLEKVQRQAVARAMRGL
jgi:hypothetical protein